MNLLDASGSLVVLLFFFVMSMGRECFGGFRSARSCIFPAKTGGGPLRRKRGARRHPFAPSSLPRRRRRVRVGLGFSAGKAHRRRAGTVISLHVDKTDHALLDLLPGAL